MKIYALLSFYDEKPDDLTRCVRSLKGFADCLVALDGAYATFPDARAMSPYDQLRALGDAAYQSVDAYKVTSPYKPWAGGEVEKRAALFELARRAGATPDDWFLIIDGDMELASYTPEARELLAASALDIAEVRWRDVQVDGVPCSDLKFRSLFRALPGLTVERAHYLYVVDCPDCDGEGWTVASTTHIGMGCCGNLTSIGDCCGNPVPEPEEALEQVECKTCSLTGRRFLWHTPNGHHVDEQFVNLHGHVTLHHYNSGRDGERKREANAYYRDRDERKLEGAGDWHR